MTEPAGRGSTASREALSAAFDRVRTAELALHEALDMAGKALDSLRTEYLESTAPLPDLLESTKSLKSREARKQAGEAIADYAHAMMLLRATLAKELVDTHGMSLAAIARRTGVSRQMVARLYKSH